MPLFPLFLDITNKNCIVIGGGNVAYRKTNTLLTYKADITVISPFICQQMQKIINENNIKLINRRYLNDDFKNSYMVLSCADEMTNLTIYEEIKNYNIYFNCSKPSDKSNFNFPAVVNIENLSIGISTSGSVPSLCSYLRKNIEKNLPQNIDKYLIILEDFRINVLKNISISSNRGIIMKKAVNLIDYNLEPQEYKQTIFKLLEGYYYEN